MISSTMNLTVPTQYWEPIRGTLTRSLFGYVPQVRSDGRPLLPPSPFNNGDGAISTGNGNGNGNGGKRKELKPIVTYISRQTAGRRLIAEDHEALVKALRELEEEGLCEVRIPVMERLSLRDQIAEVASSTVS
jgi:protein O-GlcNAc transferase